MLGAKKKWRFAGPGLVLIENFYIVIKPQLAMAYVHNVQRQCVIRIRWMIRIHLRQCLSCHLSNLLKLSRPTKGGFFDSLALQITDQSDFSNVIRCLRFFVSGGLLSARCLVAVSRRGHNVPTLRVIFDPLASN